MQRRLFAYLLLSSLPFLLGTCTLGCNKCKDLPFTTDVHEYFLDFKEGSYWIYRNVTNGDIDSVYFVSQNIYQDAGSKGGPICYQEYAVVKFNGFSENQPFAYYIKSWDDQMEISPVSAISVLANYNFQQVEDEVVAGLSYAKVMALSNCCLSGCISNACIGKYFRFLKLYYAPNVGLVRWEAENHPQFGTATYELIRYKAIR